MTDALIAALDDGRLRAIALEDIAFTATVPEITQLIVHFVPTSGGYICGIDQSFPQPHAQSQFAGLSACYLLRNSLLHWLAEDMQPEYQTTAGSRDPYYEYPDPTEQRAVPRLPSIAQLLGDDHQDVPAAAGNNDSSQTRLEITSQRPHEGDDAPRDMGPYAVRAREISRYKDRHSIETVRFLLTPPNWRVGDVPINEQEIDKLHHSKCSEELRRQAMQLQIAYSLPNKTARTLHERNVMQHFERTRIVIDKVRHEQLAIHRAWLQWRRRVPRDECSHQPVFRTTMHSQHEQQDDRQQRVPVSALAALPSPRSVQPSSSSAIVQAVQPTIPTASTNTQSVQPTLGVAGPQDAQAEVKQQLSDLNFGSLHTNFDEDLGHEHRIAGMRKILSLHEDHRPLTPARLDPQLHQEVDLQFTVQNHNDNRKALLFMLQENEAHLDARLEYYLRHAPVVLTKNQLPPYLAHRLHWVGRKIRLPPPVPAYRAADPSPTFFRTSYPVQGTQLNIGGDSSGRPTTAVRAQAAAPLQQNFSNSAERAHSLQKSVDSVPEAKTKRAKVSNNAQATPSKSKQNWRANYEKELQDANLPALHISNGALDAGLKSTPKTKGKSGTPKTKSKRRGATEEKKGFAESMIINPRVAQTLIAGGATNATSGQMEASSTSSAVQMTAQLTSTNTTSAGTNLSNAHLAVQAATPSSYATDRVVSNSSVLGKRPAEVDSEDSSELSDRFLETDDE